MLRIGNDVNSYFGASVATPFHTKESLASQRNWLLLIPSRRLRCV